MSSDFQVVGSSTGDRWKHNVQNFWIVFYQSLKQAKKPCFYTYRTVDKCPSGREPWTVDNKRVGAFNTLEEAMSDVNA